MKSVQNGKKCIASEKVHATFEKSSSFLGETEKGLSYIKEVNSAVLKLFFFVQDQQMLSDQDKFNIMCFYLP